ncbi:uncharacterized protein LOC122505380 [Leptopilina heterotoma]|uniref:uncharacterized protein LOC122505380 n=1 Tax=Leptopilina heterotoma TaxID=63436 RepID=UPI001CA80E7F|nr:uncharacterized protein LOC122505380 [Leptopilina heterotoma]
MLSIGINLRVTGHCNQGGRKYMEDMFSVAYQQSSGDRDLEYAFFGIFDGHGGGEAAAFAKEHLMDIIVKQKNFWSDKDEDVLRAIKDGYVNTHYAMWREIDKWPRTASGLPSTAGTTASIAFIRKGKIYIGHVGDSGIVLGYQDEGDPQWKAKALTKDHKPESGPEMTRIQESGGKVVSKSGVPRVVWNRPRIGHKGPVRRSTHIDEIPFLAVARALGDLWSYNSELDTFVVSPEPDVKVVSIDVKTHRCLIFGTDGLWNMLTPQAAVAIVQAAERHNEKHLIATQGNDGKQSDVQMWINPSTSLVDRALERWSSTRLRADNTSVVTLMLDPPGPSRSEVFQNQKREQAAPTDAPRRPVFCPVNPHNSGDAVRKPDENSEISDLMKSALKTCFNCAQADKNANSTTDESARYEIPESSHSLKSSKSECIQVAEISSSNTLEGERRSESLESGSISSESEGDMSSMDSISNLKNLIEKVPKPERFQVEARNSSIYSDEEVDKLFSLTRHKAFYHREMSSLEKLEAKLASNQSSRSENAQEFSSEHKGVSRQLTQNEKCSTDSESESVAEKAQHNLNSPLRQNSFCEKPKTVAGLKQKKIDSATDNVKPAVQYSRPTIITDTKRKQNSILHPEKANLYTNENLKKTSRRHSITAVSRNTLASKANLKEPGIAYLGCRIKRESKSLPGNVFDEPRIVENTTPRISNSLRGIKRRHSSITNTNDGVCGTSESCAKRRTRSEDRLNPIDENDPVNKKFQADEAHSRLRWPTSNTNLSRSGAVVNPNSAGIQERKLSSPNSFQRRNLEKKVTPVKAIRRPSINGSNRIQLRGIFGLRDWEPTRSSRSASCQSRHRTVVGLLNESTTQRWLRSDTIAATPVKTLRSRNVDITGHTVSAQIAHQYPIKQSRLPLPTKLKSTSSILAAAAATPAKAKARQSKCNTPNGVSEDCNNLMAIAGIANDTALAKRVKSPHSFSSRVSSVSPLSTRSRIKRLGK